MAFASVRFRHTFVLPILLASLVPRLPGGQSFDRAAAETNVNQQYVIESVSISGVQLDGSDNANLPGALRDRLNSLVGARCDMNVLNEVSNQLRRELHLRTVTQRLLRGSQPGRIRVNWRYNYELIHPIQNDNNSGLISPAFAGYFKTNISHRIRIKRSVSRVNQMPLTIYR